MSSPAELFNASELRGLISLVRTQQVLSPDLTDVPSKLHAALRLLMKENAIVSCRYLIHLSFPLLVQSPRFSVERELTPESQVPFPAVPLQIRGNDCLPDPPSVLGCRERSSSPCSPPRNRRRLTKRGATTETASEGTKSVEDVGQTDTESENGAEGDINEQQETTQNRDLSRGRGTGTGRIPRDSNRGAVAPPAWTHDPRPALDKDLWEEVFHGSQNLPELEVQQPGIPYVRPEPEKQILSSPGYYFVVDLALACRKFLRNVPGEENPISQIFEFVKTPGALQLDRNNSSARIGSVMAIDSLENIATRCVMTEKNSTVMDFVFMINAIQLRCKVIRSFFLLYIPGLTCSDHSSKSSICHANGWKKTPVLESIKGVKSPRTLARYVSDAAKFCLLAGGGVFFSKSPHFHRCIDDFIGTLFILAIAAAADTRSTIRNYLTHDIVLRINYLLRSPNPGRCQYSNQVTRSLNDFLDHTLGKLVIQDIIPAIDLLRHRFRTTFSSMFYQELLYSHGVIPDVEAGDLQRSDEFFNSITYK